MLKKIIFSTIFVMILIFISCSEDDSTTAPGSDSDPLPGFRISEILVSEYNYTEDTLTASYLHTYNYDLYGRIKDNIYTYYDNGSKWIIAYQYENNLTVLPISTSIDIQSKGLIYNRAYLTYENGKIKQVLQEQDTDGVIERRGKVVYNYNNNLLLSLIAYDDITGVMLKVGEGNWVYSAGRLIEHTDVEADGYTRSWGYSYLDNKINEISEYNESSLYETIVFTHTNDNISEKLIIWFDDSRRKYEYQYENDHLISYFVYSWDNLHGYENKEKREYEYDENWNLISFTDSRWSIVGNIFIPDYKREMTYEECRGNYFDIKKALSPSTYYTGFEPGELGPESYPDCKGSGKDEMFFNFSDE
ncbi:MAG: hypothetical protein KAS62_12160 [Candidatus Delongbacteria bacterium]|nr:hypothetical protein [Candidatus Delongbacteria bacterium]